MEAQSGKTSVRKPSQGALRVFYGLFQILVEVHNVG